MSSINGNTKKSLPSEAGIETEIKFLEEHLDPNHQKALPSVKGIATSYKKYKSYKMERDKALVLRLLDSNALDAMGMNNGIGLASSQEAQMAISSFLSNENAYDLIADCILHPSKDVLNDKISDEKEPAPKEAEKDEHLHIKRSYRAMTILVNDSIKAATIRRAKAGTVDHSDDSIFRNLILNNTRAGLLAKKVFAAYQRYIDELDHDDNNEEEEKANQQQELLPHIPHLNNLLQTLIEGFPSAVIGAACAGGKSGIDASLNPMLSIQQHIPESASPVPVFTQIVTRGCTGRICDPQNQQQQQQPMQPSSNQSFITKGHRRKFVRSLSEWGLLTSLINKITNNDDSASYTEYLNDNNTRSLSFHSEIACDALITIVESICYPPLNTTDKKETVLDESVGEEALLSPLASDEFVQQLAGCAVNVHSPFAVTASRALLQLFELATGRSKRSEPPPAIDATDKDFDDAQARAIDVETIPPEKNNKLLKSGLTTTMHTKLISNILFLIEGLRVHNINSSAGDSNLISSEPVTHPGRCIIEHPFTTRRLNLITLMADILNYEDHEVMNGSVKRTSIDGQLCYSSSCAALDSIIELPMWNDEMDTTEDDENTIYNPWPALCDLVFAYPENNLFQIQFYRLLHALCMTNHEATLKLVVQNSKFVSKAIANCKDSESSSLHGVLLRCLNALRLHSQSLSPRAFLRNYLESHDGWKDFQSDLRRMTMEQQLPGGGIFVPSNNNEMTNGDKIEIDLGSSFANDLGFDSTLIKPYSGSVSTEPPGSASACSKKKKKKNKKKKKKSTSTQPDSVVEED